MLVDRATIFVRSGKGGAGCLSFRREKYVPKGGPDGGDGGDGGSVILVGDASLTTLLPLTPRPHYRATNGQPGMGKSMHGADGDDCIVPVPLGTIVHDRDTGDRLVDMVEPGQKLVVAAGGQGGLGNEHFKSPTNQAPREATPGEPAIDRVLTLQLKLIADVGLIGLPNAGKSTFLRAVTRATPKVADYPFTTISPHLGIASLPVSRGGADRRLIMADIPGLIEGAAQGAGLGHDFLRHVERTQVLVHVVEVDPTEGDPASNYELVRRELLEYSVSLVEKPEIVVFNKIDLIPEEERESVLRRLVSRLGLSGDEPRFITSGATGEGVGPVLEACWDALGRDTPRGWRAG